jgi:hypothetical protein
MRTRGGGGRWVREGELDGRGLGYCRGDGKGFRPVSDDRGDICTTDSICICNNRIALDAGDGGDHRTNNVAF